MNDIKLSELISKSLSGDLSVSDRQDLDRKLSDSAPEAQSFARISEFIQGSIAEVARDSDSLQSTVRGLSEIAKQRLKNSVRQAKLLAEADTKAKSSAYTRSTPGNLKVAERNTVYFDGGLEGAPEEDRHAAARFTLLRKIGEGGLGTVWLARDEKLKRNVALKEMKPGAAESAKLWKRFEREAEITGHLEHPNVVPLYFSGVNPETGMPFYAMRFLGKQTLAEAIREYHVRRQSGDDSPLQLHRLLTIFLDVCQAIAFAHSRGVIHRDLKPENVALDNFGQVLVLDWGLAKLDSDGELAMRLALNGALEDSSVAQTIAGDVVGTPLYMSPEQAAGEMDDLDERTDVYGLGAILFAILTGFAPHENSHQSSGGNLKVADFLASIAQSESPRARQLNSSVPRELEAICAKAMHKERFARHASAKELAAAVEAWIAGKHARQAKYDSMRMNGRDLRSRLCVQLRQLGASAKFMGELPPIEELMKPVDDEQEYAIWKERLATILLALAKTRSNLTALSYAQIEGDRINELVRVERSLLDASNIRSLPQSRLRRGAANMFHQVVMQQFPGEVAIDLDFQTAGQVRVVCATPVFAPDTEEPFGLVLAESEVTSLVRPELEMIGSTDHVFIIDERDKVLFSSMPMKPDDDGNLMADKVIDRWDEIKSSLSCDEYIESDREFYATQMCLPQRNNSLRIVFRVAE